MATMWRQQMNFKITNSIPNELIEMYDLQGDELMLGVTPSAEGLTYAIIESNKCGLDFSEPITIEIFTENGTLLGTIEYEMLHATVSLSQYKDMPDIAIVLTYKGRVKGLR